MFCSTFWLSLYVFAPASLYFFNVMVSILVTIDAAFLEPIIKGVLLIGVKSTKKY